VRRDERGDPLGPDHVAEQHHDEVAGLRVELAGRLVREEQARPVRERPGDRLPLLLTAGQLVRPGLHPSAEADQLEELPDPGIALAARRPDEP
jgi:hypothetical protein